MTASSVIALVARGVVAHRKGRGQSSERQRIVYSSRRTIAFYSIREGQQEQQNNRTVLHSNLEWGSLN